jgi:hypothetical protein
MILTDSASTYVLSIVCGITMIEEGQVIVSSFQTVRILKDVLHNVCVVRRVRKVRIGLSHLYNAGCQSRPTIKK